MEVGVAQLAEQVEDALALVGQGDDAGGHALDGVGPVEGLQDLADVVAVDDLGLPAEGRELAVDRVHVQDLLGGAGLLVVVAVDDQREVVELILGGRGGGLPVLALVELAVAGHDVGVIAFLSTRAASAWPMPIESPWPSEPVEASTPASRLMLGWPSTGLPILRRVMISSCGK